VVEIAANTEYMVWDVCGKSFSPQASKINGDAKITDAASCTTFAEDKEKRGNMYVVKDGKCVQSFKYGEFEAEVEQQETGKPKQKWELKYTSL
jgi:hypothetical protein